MTLTFSHYSGIAIWWVQNKTVENYRAAFYFYNKMQSFFLLNVIYY